MRVRVRVRVKNATASPAPFGAKGRYRGDVGEM